MDTKKQMTANISLLLVAVIWGFGFVAGKMALTGMTPFAALTYRFGLAMLVCGLIFHKHIRNTPKSTMKKGCIIGTIQMLALSVQLIGLQYTTPAKQSFLCTAYVALVPFISWVVLKERPGIRSVLAGFLALSGIGLISLKGSLAIGLGDGLSLCFSLLFGLQIVLVGKLVGDDADSIQLSFFQFLAAASLAFIISLFRGESFRFGGMESFIGVLYLAIPTTLIAFLVQNTAQKYTSDTITSLLLSLESVFGFLFSVLYYHETVSPRFFAGSLLCFAAILLNSVKKPVP